MAQDDRQPASTPAVSSATSSTNQKTDIRRQNPLSSYSSYTYHISLYILTPEAAVEFQSSGVFPQSRTDYFVIAQSGGIRPTDRRAITDNGRLGTGTGLDFYLEDLTIESLLTTGSRPIVETKVEFKIVEPTGFTLLTRLAKTVKEINLISPMLQKSGAKPNLFQHHYALGIRFIGYDENGNLIDSATSSVLESNLKTCERYFSIVISNMTYKLDGRAVTYQVNAVPLGQSAALGLTRGVFKKTSTVIASTVGQAIGTSSDSGDPRKRSVIDILNDQQYDEKNTNRIDKLNRYSVEWLGPDIKNSSVITDADFNTATLGTVSQSTVRTTNESNVKISAAAETYDTTSRQITIDQGTPVISVIDNIIAKSTWVTDKLLAKNTAVIEAKTKLSDNKAPLEWYTVAVKTKPRDWDNTIRDWVYDIVYQIQPYYIPYLRSLYKNKTTKYYGAHKKYNYFLTGQNTEIISYEMSYDSQFFVIKAISTSTDVGANAEAIDSTVPISPQGGNSSSINQGAPNSGNIIENNVRAMVNNVVDQATLTLKIIGDPDYLMTCVTNMPSFQSTQFKKLYGPDGYSINPYGGQIFIEIIFKIAEDYQTNGLLDVSDSVQFYKSHAAAKKLGIDGIIYRLTTVTSTFRGGKFEQELKGLMVSETDLGIQATDQNSAERESTQKTAPGLYSPIIAKPAATATRDDAVIESPISGKTDYRSVNERISEALSATGASIERFVRESNPNSFVRLRNPR